MTSALFGKTEQLPTSISSKICVIQDASKTHRLKERAALDHLKLVEIYENLGFGKEEGLCLGVALMGVRAFLANDAASFHERFQKLSDLYDECQGDMKKICDKITQDVDMMAFFNGISLYQHDNNLIFKTEIPDQLRFLEDVFEGHINLEQEEEQLSKDRIHKVSQILIPKKLEKAQKSIDLLKSFCGACNLDELVLLFKSLIPICHSCDPIAFLLVSEDHAISIYYDISEKCWMLIDANQIRRIENEPDLARAVLDAFEKTSHVLMITNIYSLGDNKDGNQSTRQQLQIWSNSQEVKRVHNLNNKKWLTPDECDRLLIESLMIRDSHMLEALLKAGVNPNKNFDDLDGLSPIFLVETPKDIELLVRAGVSVNTTWVAGITPLYAAILDESLENVQTLLKLGANPCHVIKHEKIPGGGILTPLSFASLVGNEQIVQVLKDAIKPKTSKL